jgi:hypothetical protein
MVFTLLLLVATGCSTLPISGPLPDNLNATKLTNIDEAAPFAISPSGNVVAYPDAGLKLLHLPTRERLEITPKRPEQLAWSPSGYSLAASFYHEGKSTITTFDQYGIQVAEAVVDGRITDLDWLSENELVAAAVSVTNYKFGSNYKSIIHRWQPGTNYPVTTALRDSTLQPSTMAMLLVLLERGPMLAVPPETGQILYMHPNDPPVFTPYYRLILRDLSNNRELEIAQLNLNSDGGRFSSNGELIFYGDGIATTTIYNPWTEETLGKINTRGKNLEISPSGNYWFADGALFRDKTLLTTLAPGGVARFTQDGRQLILAANGSLYLLSGLQPAGEKIMTRNQLGKLSRIRSWRVEGLMSAKEYKEALERIKQP